MEARVAELGNFADEVRAELRAIDGRLSRIESRLDATGTKLDVAELGATMVKRIVGTVSGLGIASITVMTFVLNNAAPKATNLPQAPINITVPLPPATR